jgi:hypothetical protein
MADFEIEDDGDDYGDNSYNFSANWNSKKPSSAYFGGAGTGGGVSGGGGDDDPYNFAFDSKPVNSKSKRNTQFSPDSSGSSFGGKLQNNRAAPAPSSKPHAAAATNSNSALDLANSVLAKYSSKPSAVNTNHFVRKSFSRDFDEDAISVGSDDEEEFDLSESGTNNLDTVRTAKSGPSALNMPSSTSLAQKGIGNTQKAPARSAFEMVIFATGKLLFCLP